MEKLVYNAQLSELVKGAPELLIEGIFSDSRLRVENGLFFCVKGLTNDGHQHAEQAIRNGAVAVVHSDELEIYHDDVFYIKVKNVLKELNRITALFYKEPSKELLTYAVTGTNGKSTVSYTIFNILNHFESAGYVGTISIEYNDVSIAPEYTTPDIVELNETLADMRDQGVKSLAIETSSHGLVQHRVDSLDTDVAIFTNLTHEHLDYHGTMDNYFDAKAILFENLKDDAVAIINVDDEYGKKMVQRSKGHVCTYGIDQEADYMAKDIVFDNTHTEFTLVHRDLEYPIKTNMLARFNVYNLLAVIAALHHTDFELDVIIDQLQHVKQVDGRMEVIDEGQPFTVIVDYAHTPDGFEKLFQYTEKIKGDRRVISLFGSAGKRDLSKRPVLGAIADKYSDMIILTEDDPRNEAVEDIAKEIAAGIEDTNYVVIKRRYDAIYQAISQANRGDIILLMGKGDDNYMARENGRERWYGDDNIARRAIKEYYGDEEENEEK